MTDPIADLLTRIRNAQMAGNDSLAVPYSREKEKIAQVMQKNDFLESVEKEETEKVPALKLTLTDRKLTLKRISKPGQRIYIKSKEIRKVLSGFGISIISTPKGIITGYEARSLNVGGEVLCEIS